MTPSLEKRLSLQQQPKRVPIVMHQKLRDLFFIHWEVDPKEIQKTLPLGLYVDTFNDKAYLGIVSFKMCDVRTSFMPPIAGISNFLELVVQTYVYDKNGNPGIWFYSLISNRWLATFVAQKFFYLPFSYAKTFTRKISQTITYEFKSPQCNASALFELSYSNNYEQPRNSSLEFFLVERYLYYTIHKKQLHSGRFFHHPHLISHAKIKTIYHNNLFKPIPVNNDEIAYATFSPGIDVKAAPLVKI